MMYGDVPLPVKLCPEHEPKVDDDKHCPLTHFCAFMGKTFFTRTSEGDFKGVFADECTKCDECQSWIKEMASFGYKF